MSDSVISVENLSKSYLIGHQGPRERYSSLRDSLASGAKSMLRKTRDLAMGKQSLQGDSVEEFWALKDVSLEVKQGEVLGIIGRNGAGKSTLLKVLSRITEPTSGRVTLNGRVASLLEVGTGFHPELTGRENLYLNGAILGMSRKEIRNKFDEIVDFAGVEKFLDTPVKRYSSGMYVRLAFAVAAHLEPEILVVDEVLAVGDAEFQKKCMGKMKDVATGGRTVLFVSHNLKAISDLCTSCCLLHSGKLVLSGKTEDVLAQYAKNQEDNTKFSLEKRIDRTGDQNLVFTRVEYEVNNKPNSGVLPTGSNVKIIMHYRASDEAQRWEDFRFSIAINNSMGTMFICSTELTSDSSPHIEKQGFLVCNIPELPLSRGFYTVTVFAEGGGAIQDWIEDASVFEVSWGNFFATNHNAPKGHEGSSVLVRHNWI